MRHFTVSLPNIIQEEEEEDQVFLSFPKLPKLKVNTLNEGTCPVMNPILSFYSEIYYKLCSTLRDKLIKTF